MTKGIRTAILKKIVPMLAQVFPKIHIRCFATTCFLACCSFVLAILRTPGKPHTPQITLYESLASFRQFTHGTNQWRIG